MNLLKAILNIYYKAQYLFTDVNLKDNSLSHFRLHVLFMLNNKLTNQRQSKTMTSFTKMEGNNVMCEVNKSW